MSHAAWGLASVAADIASFLVYAAGVLGGKRRPGRTGWIMFGLFYTYLAVAAAGAGATWSDLILVSEAAGCVWIAWLSLRHGEDDLKRRPGDRWLMLAARNPGVSLCFAWLITICALWPLLAPAWRLAAGISVDAAAVSQVVSYARRHGGESPWSWALYAASGGLSGLAVAQPWPSVLYAYPVAAEIFGVLVLWALWCHREAAAAGRRAGRVHRDRLQRPVPPRGAH